MHTSAYAALLSDHLPARTAGRLHQREGSSAGPWASALMGGVIIDRDAGGNNLEVVTHCSGDALKG